MKKIILSIIVSFAALACYAQDHIYSQFYNAPNYLNPALNGQFQGDLRLSMSYRNQWTQIPGNLSYYTFSLDYQVPDFEGGVGLMVTKSSEGTAYLNKTNISGIYSYSVDFENAVLSFGLQAGMTNRSVDYNKLIFLDQLDAGGIIPGGASAADQPQLNNRFYFDSGAGINLVYGDFMIGTSAQHINKPDETLTGTKSILPMRVNCYASYRLPLDSYKDENSPYLIPSVVVYNQAKINYYSIGFQLKRGNVNAGLWYRSSGQQQDAIVVSFIFDLFSRREAYNKIRFGISHDVTTSKLPYTNTAGTTEGSLSYETLLGGNGSRGYDLPRGHDGNRCYNFY